MVLQMKDSKISLRSQTDFLELSFSWTTWLSKKILIVELKQSHHAEIYGLKY